MSRGGRALPSIVARAFAIVMAVLVACDQGRPPPPAPAGTAQDGELAYLPGETDLVVRLDLPRLRASKLWPTYEGEVARLVIPFTVGCGYQPLDEAASLVFGIQVAAAGPARSVLRGIDREKLRRCLLALYPAWSVTFEGDVTRVDGAGGAYALSFVDPTTLVMQGGRDARKPVAIQIVRDAPLARDAALSRVLHALPHAGVTLASRPGSAAVAESWKQLGVHLESLSGHLDLDTQLTLEVSLVLGTSDEAKQLTEVVGDQLGSESFKSLFDRIGVTVHGETSTLDLALGEDKLAKLVAMYASLWR